MIISAGSRSEFGKQAPGFRMANPEGVRQQQQHQPMQNAILIL